MIDTETEPVVDTDFATDVRDGLSLVPKQLSSRYFYDATGDKIFQQIMQLEEYYPTRTELGIFQNDKKGILEAIGNSFRIVELGAGDGMKTKVLLNHFVEQNVDFAYSPVDISGDIVEELKSSLVEEVPGLRVEPFVGDYFQIMGKIMEEDQMRKVVFFLGSNIGNYNYVTRNAFLKELRNNLNEGDQVLIGFDMKKDPKVILDAYNDAKGVTESFNKNLLVRINNELGGNFDPDLFLHAPTYDPNTGECKSYLLSREDQEVTVEAINRTFLFKKWEPIFMEVSKKFDREEIEVLASKHGFELKETFTDEQGWFVDAIWKAV